MRAVDPRRLQRFGVGLSWVLSACGAVPEAPLPPPSVPPPVSAPSTPAPRAVPVPAALQAVIDAPDRAEADRALDKGRHPGETLAFFGVRAGMKVAELAAGSGYTTELLARAVGPTGKVWGQNPRFVLHRLAGKSWESRLAQPLMKHVVRVDRELDDPLPPEATGLDVVIMVLFYHDTFWLKVQPEACEACRRGPGPCDAACRPVDRAAMNRAVFRALKPGGVFGIVDHSGRPGTGATEVQSLHRIDEKTVRDDVEAAGFRLVEAGDFLRNPADPRDWNDAPGAAGERRGTSDRFALKFVKP